MTSKVQRNPFQKKNHRSHLSRKIKSYMLKKWIGYCEQNKTGDFFYKTGFIEFRRSKVTHITKFHKQHVF